MAEQERQLQEQSTQASDPESATAALTGAVDRRTVIKSLTLLAGAAGLGGPAMAAQADTYPKPSPAAQDPVFADQQKPVVEVEQGKVRGYLRNGIATFKGIPYGEDTATARFMPAQKAKPWTGLRSSMQYGSVCPQPDRAGWKQDENAWMFSWDDGVPGEDCLRVNVWTPAINDHKKRSVMVWLHGGGFAAGSGQELLSYDGENLARRGDVVVVSLNHRLNVFGHLDLSSFGSQYAQSGNVGMLDIVLALEWVRDNIAGFGGDPGCVTVFGQSGGGGKVCALTTMPSAQGLFHRAIVESGSLGEWKKPEDSARTATAFFKELQIDASSGSSLNRLQTLSWREIEAAAVKATASNGPRGLISFRHPANLLGWAPVLDGHVIVEDAFAPKTPDRVKNRSSAGGNRDERVHNRDGPP